MREAPIDIHNATPASGMIEVSDLQYMAGETPLLDIPALRFRDGGTTVVMGPNGAGKSLLLRLLHGLIQPKCGRVLSDGRPLDAALQRQQALVFQKPVLLRRSVAANLDFVLKARGKSRGHQQELLRHVGLADVSHRPARQLSGGEQQRLAIALALATEPKVLFLDEPTASLDPASTLAIEDIVKQTVAGGVRVIFVTHDIGQARRLADDVVFLANGKLAEQADAATFFDNPKSPVARAYLGGKINELVED